MSANQDLLAKLRVDKEGSFTFRRRRQPDWTDNYTLYRDKVQLNRLTQRQSVNIPLLKSTVKTLLKDIDDPPILYFTNLDNNDQAEVFYNEYWQVNSIQNQTVIKDVVDKRQVLLFGRSFKALNIVDGDFAWEVVDPQDMLVDRYVDPANLDSARFIIREHIYKPLSSLRTNPMWDTAATKRLQEFFATEMGLLKAEENQLDWVQKNARMAAMGVTDVWTPTLGETYVELNEFFVKEFNKVTNKDEITYVVAAEDMEVLYTDKLDNVIGKTSDDFWKTRYPYTTWGDETERTDFWSDGVADSLRPLNKILNAWFSQLVENRTLQSYGMNYFNSSMGDEGFVPQTFDPVPGGWYPIPVEKNGKITDNVMHIEIPSLENTIEDMNFVMTIAQQASAATTFQQGVQPDNSSQITLGEVNILVANAQERVKSMAVYYTASWEEFGVKFAKMLEAAGDLITPTFISKKGRLTKKQYSKIISPKDWETENGYKVEVKMKEDQQKQTADSLQKLQYSKALMPMNMALDTIIKKKSLEFADLSSAETAEVLKEDEQSKMSGMNGMPMQGAPVNGAPQQGGLPQQVQPQPAHMLPA